MRNAIRSEPHGFDTFGQFRYNAICSLRNTARFCNTSNIVEYVQEACWLEVHNLWRAGQSLGEPCNRAITDCAHVTQFLGENDIGP
jgi:hypothetical protein